MEPEFKIAILAAGDFPTHSIPLQTVREADFVVVCDSAYNSIHSWLHRVADHSSQFTIHNYVVIGDGDSLSAEDKQQLGDRWIQVDEQDYNDLHKAMAYATSRFEIGSTGSPTTVGSTGSPTSVHFTILGATGKREDHTLGNISYLVTFAEEYPDADIEMLTDHGRLVAMRGERTFESFPRQQVSIFVMDPDDAITSDGLRWPLDRFHARRWWQASLNEALAASFTLRSEGWLVVFQTYEAKD